METYVKAILTSAALLFPLSSTVTASAQSDLRAYYKDDFILETSDKAFQLRIRGNLHVDTRLYQGEECGSPDSIDVRRVRYDLQGRIHEFLIFRVQPEFAGSPYIRNAWLDVEFAPWLHLRVGQMKVPFSSSWATLDNNVNFVERGTSAPVYPFFDRGALLWGELWEGAVIYNLGLYTGAGVDLDSKSGDIDDYKDLAARFLFRPFVSSEVEALRRLYLAVQGTWGRMSVPTSRCETGGLRSANYQTAVWRWRTEQTIGTDGRNTDRVAAEIDTRFRLGGELHYQVDSLAFSAEYLEVQYRGIELYHDLYSGSSRKVREKLHESDGAVRSLSMWVSCYLTGESKRLTNLGWKTPKPIAPVGSGGIGAWEILGRYSKTWTSRNLFRTRQVDGYEDSPGAGNSVKLAVLDGAHEVHEVTLGVCWTINPMLRLQLNDVLLWAPSADRNGDGVNDNLLVSGAKSNQSDPMLKNRKTSWENAVMLRMIFKL